MTQHELIYTFIVKNGSITPMEAFTELGITKLATRIGEMIRAGYAIKKEVVEGVSRWGQKTRYIRYSLCDD